MPADGLIDSDAFNYVSNISFSKTQSEHTKPFLAISRVPILRVNVWRWSGWKREIIYFRCIKKKETVLRLAVIIIPCHTIKALTIKESLTKHFLDSWQRPHCMTPCSWEQHRWINTAAWEQYVVCPILAHLEQWWSLEIFFFFFQ